MKFGVREICDVVLKAKAKQKIGNKTFFKDEPVIYFDTLKTSSMEGAATTVYAQGGRGNSRLMAWEGERTVTFTMEDALISPAGFMILSGAGLIEGQGVRGDNGQKIKVHTIEQTQLVSLAKTGEGENTTVTGVDIVLKKKPYNPQGAENFVYVMLLSDGEVVTEPYIPSNSSVAVKKATNASTTDTGVTSYIIGNDTWINATGDSDAEGYLISLSGTDNFAPFAEAYLDDPTVVVLVDYYTEKGQGTYQIDITPDKFGGNYYLEASTLFRNTNGVDMPAEFIIPNCKIQSNFSFTMASSGDPSTFTFTIDAFPDYTRFDKTKKVLAAIQVITEDEEDVDNDGRTETESGYKASSGNA